MTEKEQKKLLCIIIYVCFVLIKNPLSNKKKAYQTRKKPVKVVCNQSIQKPVKVHVIKAYTLIGVSIHFVYVF